MNKSIKKIVPICLFISALGIDHYELIIENNTNNQITVERDHMIDGLGLHVQSDVKVRARQTSSHVVTIANNCKDSLLQVKNRNQECHPMGFTFPVAIHSTEESDNLPITKLIIEEVGNDKSTTINKKSKQRKNYDYCTVRIEEINQQ